MMPDLFAVGEALPTRQTVFHELNSERFIAVDRFGTVSGTLYIDCTYFGFPMTGGGHADVR